MSNSDYEKRLMDLEVKLMDQDQMLSDLSDMVNRQWTEIEALKAKLKSAHSRIISLEETAPSGSGDTQKPPHY